MNFILPPPSLQDRIYATIAITLWSLCDFGSSLEKSFHELTKDWQQMEEKVEEKASKLSLAPKLKEKLLEIIIPVGLQILSWIECHSYEHGFITEMPTRLFWTPHGTIDNKRTAEALVKDDKLCVEQRFQLACFYCLVDDILDMREKCDCSSRYFTKFWSDYLDENNDTRRMQKILANLKVFAAFGNEAAMRYFCFQLKSQNTVQLRMKTAKMIAEITTPYETDVFNDTLYFFLCTMTVEQQTEIIEGHLYSVLKSLLVWPRQCLFLEAAKNKWDFLSKEHYTSLLHEIICRMRYKQKDFSEIFGEFWQQSPETYKKFVINESGVRKLLIALRKKEDETNIQLIMEYSNNLEKKT